MRDKVNSGYLLYCQWGRATDAKIALVVMSGLLGLLLIGYLFFYPTMMVLLGPS